MLIRTLLYLSITMSFTVMAYAYFSTNTLFGNMIGSICILAVAICIILYIIRFKNAKEIYYP